MKAIIFVVLVGMSLLAGAPKSSAAVIVQNWYRLGENDAAAVPGQPVDPNSKDQAGAIDLFPAGTPVYSADVLGGAAPQTASRLAAHFDGASQCLSNHVLTVRTDNFVLEAWVKPEIIDGSTHCLVYNGNTASSGWGLYMSGSAYVALFGGRAIFGSAAGAASTNAWTHLALVRDSGTATLYVNGAPVRTATNSPASATDAFGIGWNPTALPGEHFRGLVDEVRLATFAAGQFSTNDLLWNNPLMAANANDGYSPQFDGPLVNIYTAALQPDGKLVAAGTFESVDFQPAMNVTRLNADGRRDLTFNASIDDTAFSVAVQPDGKILLGGVFTNVNTVIQPALARLNPDGTLEANFHPVFYDALSQSAGEVDGITLQADGKIVLGGIFTQIDGHPCTNLARLNWDGSVDTNFTASAGDDVTALAVQPDGRILVGGVFTNLNGAYRSALGRLNPDGTLDAAFDPQVADGQLITGVYALALQPDGKILAGGDFQHLGGRSQLFFGRINVDGSVDTNFNPSLSGFVYAIGLQSDGKILAEGTAALVRLNTDGSVDPTFQAQSPYATFALAVQPDQKIILAGHALVSRYYPDGSKDTAITNAADAAVAAVAVLPGDSLLVGGSFTALGGLPHRALCRLNPDGSVYTNVLVEVDGTVQCLAMQSDGRALVGGNFATLGGRPHASLGRLNPDGTVDTAFTAATDFNVSALEVQTNGYILVGGTFATLDGQPHFNLGRLQPGGAVDAAFHPDPNGTVLRLAVQPDGQILVAGLFTQLANLPWTNFGRLTGSGTLDTSFAPNPLGRVTAMVAQPDGKILVGGEFTNIAGTDIRYLARLNSDGSLDTNFQSAADIPIDFIGLSADGRILVAGRAAAAPAGSPYILARLNVDGSLDPTFRPNSDGSVLAFALQSDGKIAVGGTFENIGGQPRHLLARLTSGSPAASIGAATSQTISWRESATGPQITQTWFDLSSDGTNYTSHLAVFDGSAWSLTGLQLPARTNLYVRIRALSAPNVLLTQVRQLFLNADTVVLTGMKLSANGGFQLQFTAPAGPSYHIFASPDPGLPFQQWTFLGTAQESVAGQFTFTDLSITNQPHRFYRLEGVRP